jgi:hypothetical protein
MMIGQRFTVWSVLADRPVVLRHDDATIPEVAAARSPPSVSTTVSRHIVHRGSSAGLRPTAEGVVRHGGDSGSLGESVRASVPLDV